jgi:pimeloyl-ACP methyl ester carboxylesterase
MLRAPVDDIRLEYEVRGAGDPVVLVHGGVFADWFAGLAEEPALAGHRLIRYHRAGYAGSDRHDGPVSIADQAAHCRALLAHLGIARAHVVGHSSGATIALQLALDHPEAVRSLALLETALLTVPSGPFAGDAMRHHRAGDRAAAVDTWMRGVAGADYRAALDRVLPGAFDRGVADADTFFGQELPAVREWSFGPAEAARVTRPVLAVLGGRSGEVTPAFQQRHELLLEWLPAAEPFVLPGATHLLHVHNPTGMAQALAGFFARH